MVWVRKSPSILPNVPTLLQAADLENVDMLGKKEYFPSCSAADEELAEHIVRQIKPFSTDARHWT